jgi:hypothetical protein
VYNKELYNYSKMFCYYCCGVTSNQIERKNCGTEVLHIFLYNAGADPGFKVRGAHLKKWRQAEGGAKIFGVFRVRAGRRLSADCCFSALAL